MGVADRFMARPEDETTSPTADALLRDPEKHLQLLVASVRDYAIFMLDTTGHVITWNPGAERIKGYRPEEILGQHFSRFYPEADVASGKCEHELAVAAREGRFEDEGWRVRKDGTRFWANVVITAMRNANGELVGYAKVTRDLTERKRAEDDRVARATAEEKQRAQAALLAAETRARELLATTLRSIGDAVITTDAEGRVTMMNPIAESLTGWPSADAIGKPVRVVFRIVNERTRVEVESPVAKVLREGVVVGLANHTVLVSRTGADTPIDDSGAPIRDADGRIVGVVLVFRNATAEKAEQMRRAFLADVSVALSTVMDSREMLQAVARLAVPRLADWAAVDLAEDDQPSQVAVAHSDPAKVELAREWAVRYPPAPDAPRGVPNVLRTGVSELYAEITDELLAAGAQDAEHLRIARALGLRSAIVVPIRGRERILGAITLVHAESGRRYTEDDLAFAEDLGRRAALALERARLFEDERRARAAADEANRTKDQFLAAMSHELRTPLNGIVGWSTLVANGALGPDKQAGAIDAIVRNAKAMTRLVEDLLDVSRIMSGKMRLDVVPTAFAPVVEAAIDVVRPAAEAKHIRIESVLDTGGSEIAGDATRLQQVVWNLLTNAVKFTPSGGTVRVALRNDGASVELSVTDSGQGIDPQFLPHVFDLFRQADTGIARSSGGLGLGLSISRHIVEAHGGSIEARSEGLARGATFVVRLPALPARRTAEARSHEAVAPFVPPPELHARHALLVDDDPDARAMVTAMLERCGMRVTSADNLTEALSAIEREPPDVLVSDIAMPGGDGYDLIRQVRALPPERGGKVPAAALTAYARSDDRRRALSAGYTAHLGKPVDPAELCAVVAALTRHAPRTTP